MVAKTNPSKASNTRSSTFAMMVVGAVWVALLWGSAAEASRDLNRNVDFNDYHRFLKDSKKSKSCKSGACLEDEELIELFDMIDGNTTDGNSTSISEDEETASTSKSYNSKSSKKGSKSGSYYGSKSASTKKSKTKSEKTSKGSKGSKKSDKSAKSCKSSKKSKGCVGDDEDDFGFTPEVAWTTTFPDAVDTGFLFYDKVTKYAWYAYTAEAGPEDLVSVSTEVEGVDVAIAAVKTGVKYRSEDTIGKICPMDVADSGKLKEDLCIEITASENATSTEIVAAEVCYSVVNDSILKMAVVVEDTAKDLVGSRLIAYDVVAGDVILENFYEGWKSLYASPVINGQPAFTPDCKNVFTSWLSPMDLDSAGSGLDIVDSTTIATKIEKKTSEDAEIWRLGTSGRLAGLTSTKDGKTLISAANIPPEDDLNVGGIVKLDVSTGEILDQFIWPSNSLDLPHNAFTNPLVDANGNTYYIDSLLGLVKFDGDDLNDGPVWSAVGGYYRKEIVVEEVAEEEAEEEKAEVKEVTAQTKMMVPENEIDVRRRLRMLSSNDEDAPFTAFQPALDYAAMTVYGCGMTTRDEEYDGVIALEASDGDKVWHTKFTDYQVVNVGSCRGITDDIVFGPSSASSMGDAVFVARDDVIHALDAVNGTSIWKFDFDGPGVTKFVVVSEKLVVAANTGVVVGLDTSEPLPPNATKTPTIAPTAAPNGDASLKPTRAPLPDEEPTAAPTASASMLGFSSFATLLAALPLVLALLR